MQYILSYFIYESLFIWITVIWKRLRKSGVSTQAVLAIFVFSLPVLGLILGYAVFAGDFQISWMYVFWVLCWVLCNLMVNFGNVYLFRFQGLLEITGYRYVFSVMIALLIEYGTVGNQIPWSLFLFLLVTLCGGASLSFQREKTICCIQSNKLVDRVSFMKMIGIVLAVSVASVACAFIFKYSLSLQKSYYTHAAVMQFFMFITFFSMGRKELCDSLQNKLIRWRDVSIITVLIVPAALFEAYAYTALLAVVILAMTIVKTVLFTLHDFWTKELTLTWSNVLSTLIVIIGISGIGFVYGVGGL